MTPINGVYAILGPHGVYVGESRNCWSRNTLGLAVALGWECGIVRELPGASRLERVREEAAVAKLFERRGLPVVSHYLSYAWPEQYAGLRVKHPRPMRAGAAGPKPVRPKHTTVTHEADGRMVIQTDSRRASAALQVLAGATLQEVGDGLGVSRERIRQYLGDMGLKTKMRVIQKSTVTVRTAKLMRGIARKRGRRETFRARVHEVVGILQNFGQTSGRAPTLLELYRLVFKREPKARSSVAPTLILHLGRVTGRRRLMRRLHAVYHLAGLEVRAAGGAGQIGGPGAATRLWWSTRTTAERAAHGQKIRRAVLAGIKA